VPDLSLPVPLQGFHGMLIELKVRKNKPSKEQVQLVDAVAEQVYYAAVCWVSRKRSVGLRIRGN
jgi:hypothetical protein